VCVCVCQCIDSLIYVVCFVKPDEAMSMRVALIQYFCHLLLILGTGVGEPVTQFRLENDP